MPLAGMALDRFSVRVVTSVGTVLLVGSLVLTAMVRNYWQFAVVYGVLVPLGLAGTGPVIASGVVARWFSRRRGTALSVLGSASMTGMSLLVPAVTWLILTARLADDLRGHRAPPSSCSCCRSACWCCATPRSRSA